MRTIIFNFYTVSNFDRPQTKLWEGNVLHLSVVLFTEIGLCPGGSLSRLVSVQRVSVQGGLCPGGYLSKGYLSRGFQSGGLCPGRYLSRGSLSRRGLCPRSWRPLSPNPGYGGRADGTHPTGMYSCSQFFSYLTSIFVIKIITITIHIITSTH